MRLDKFLKTSRVIKRRTVANEAADSGRISVNGKVVKPSYEVKIGDIVELTDLNNQTVQYQIYDIFKTDPNDVTILETKDETIREVTLITCTNGNRERLILKAKEL